MSKFYGITVNGRGNKIKTDKPQSTQINAWDTGCKIVPRIDKTTGREVFEIFATGGTNATANDVLVARLEYIPGFGPLLTPVMITETGGSRT